MPYVEYIFLILRSRKAFNTCMHKLKETLFLTRALKGILFIYMHVWFRCCSLYICNVFFFSSEMKSRCKVIKAVNL